jgi:hypothetical protein
MITPLEFWLLIGEDDDEAAKAGRPFRAWVGDDTNGLVTLAWRKGGTVGKQRFPRLTGPTLAAGTEVLVAELLGELVVLGAIQVGEYVAPPGVGGAALVLRENAITVDAALAILNVEYGLNVYGGSAGNRNLEVDAGATGTIASRTGAQTLTNKTLTSPAITTPTGIVKGDVGLGNVDNTADTAKPVSTAQQAALDLKQDKASENHVRLSGANLTQTTVTPANMTGLSFAIAANEVWNIDLLVMTGCSGTGGVKVDVTVPTGATLRLNLFGTAASMSAFSSAVLTAGATLSAAFNVAAFQNGFIRVTGVIINGGTAGTVQFRYAAGTAGQTATIYAGSTMSAHRMS